MPNRQRKLTHAMRREIRALFLNKGEKGRLDIAIRERYDGEQCYRTHDCNEWGSEDSLHGLELLDGFVGHMNVYAGLHLEVWLYCPDYATQPRDDYQLERQYIVRFNGVRWELLDVWSWDQAVQKKLVGGAAC